MNILYANESFAPMFDGVAVCAQNYAEIVNRKYGKSYMLVPYHEQRLEEDFAYELLQCPTSKTTIVNQYKICLPMPIKLKNRIDKMPIDLVHSHCPFITGILSMNLAKRREIPHVSTFHSKYKDDINQRLKSNMELPGEVVAKYVASFYNRCDYVWTLNEGTANTLREYGYKGEVTIMPNGCDMPVTYRDDNIRREIALKYGLNPEYPIFLFVGRVTYVKRVDLTVKALGALKRRGKKFSMLIVGSGEDEDKLKNLIRELGLEDTVKFAGKVMDRGELRRIYSSCDLFVFPSVYDNAPLVVREAAACGTPSLLIENSNSAEGVTDGINGILARESVEDVALAINDAVTNYDLKKLGESARETIYISWEDVIEKAVGEYERIIRDFKPGRNRFKIKTSQIYDIDLEKDFELSVLKRIKIRNAEYEKKRAAIKEVRKESRKLKTLSDRESRKERKEKLNARISASRVGKRMIKRKRKTREKTNKGR